MMDDELGLKLPVYNVHLSQCTDGKPHKPLFEEGDVNLNDIYGILDKYQYNSVVVLELKSIFDKEIYRKNKKILER